MAFQGIISGKVQSKLYLSGKVASDKCISGTPGLSSSIVGTPGLNVLEVIDAYNYFKTEDNINFLVTEDGNYLVI